MRHRLMHLLTVLLTCLSVAVAWTPLAAAYDGARPAYVLTSSPAVDAGTRIAAGTSPRQARRAPPVGAELARGSAHEPSCAFQNDAIDSCHADQSRLYLELCSLLW